MQHLVENLINSVEAIQSRSKELSKQRSKVDKMISTIYHVLEFESLDAVKLMKVTKRLRICLRERREIKDELRYVQSILDALPDLKSRIEKVDKKKENDHTRYINETKALENILNLLEDNNES